MAKIFISHSSRDAEQAEQMKAWLHQKGFAETFLDFDKHAGIPPGANWEKELYSKIEQSEAMIVIATPNWLDSKWCFAEFTQARALGKPIFPIIYTPLGDAWSRPTSTTSIYCPTARAVSSGCRWRSGRLPSMRREDLRGTRTGSPIPASCISPKRTPPSISAATMRFAGDERLNARERRAARS